MPRKPRLHYEGALYHVITRGNNRQKIFLSEDDYKIFLKYLTAIKNKKPFYLYAYCLMPNHIHLLIEVKEDPLSVIMQRLLTGYTAYYNRTKRKRGHLFQGRYKAILCEKDSYLLELVRYMHLNPVRARIAKKASDWEWSGHRCYMGKSSSSLVDIDKILKYFSGEKSEARKRYEEFVRAGSGMGHNGDIYPEEKMPYLGEDKFIEEHIIKHLELIERKTPGTVKQKHGLTEILKDVCVGSGINPEMVQGDSRKEDVAQKRKEFIAEAYKAGHKASDIARFINRTHSFVSRLIDSGNL